MTRVATAARALRGLATWEPSLIVWAADKLAVEPSAKVTTTDPSAWTWTSVALELAALTAATTFAFSSSVSADGL